MRGDQECPFSGVLTRHFLKGLEEGCRRLKPGVGVIILLCKQHYVNSLKSFLIVDCHANVSPSTGHRKSIAQPKADKYPTSHVSPFNCYLSIIL